MELVEYNQHQRMKITRTDDGFRIDIEVYPAIIVLAAIVVAIIISV